MASVMSGPYEYHPETNTVETTEGIILASVPAVAAHQQIGNFLTNCANRYPKLLAIAEQLANEIHVMPDPAEHISFEAFEGLVDVLAVEQVAPPKPRTAQDVLESMLAELEGPMMGHWTEGMDNFVREARRLLGIKPPPKRADLLLAIELTANNTDIDPAVRLKEIARLCEKRAKPAKEEVRVEMVKLEALVERISDLKEKLQLVYAGLHVIRNELEEGNTKKALRAVDETLKEE
jgi:hypothetical protein